MRHAPTYAIARQAGPLMPRQYVAGRRRPVDPMTHQCRPSYWHYCGIDAVACCLICGTALCADHLLGHAPQPPATPMPNSHWWIDGETRAAVIAGERRYGV